LCVVEKWGVRRKSGTGELVLIRRPSLRHIDATSSMTCFRMSSHGHMSQARGQLNINLNNTLPASLTGRTFSCFIFRSLSGIFDKNTVKNTATPAQGIRLINAHLVPFLNALRTRSCGRASIDWMEVRPEFACAIEAMADADSRPDSDAALIR
jgi:hypothetical protein